MPHLKELVKLYEDKPFAILGINSGDNLESYKKGMKTHGLTWLSAYQSDSNDILNNVFHVRGFPSYFLVDAEGNFAGVNMGLGQLDNRIKELVDALDED
tara:strand:+ start:4738 stop:5034 length:297 start_codon:yes stop_codon:yes gene_type:complete